MIGLVKNALLGAAVLLGLAAGSANAVTVNTGDTVRIDYFLSGTAFHPDADADFYFFLSGFGAGESFFTGFYDALGLYATLDASGPGGGVVTNYFGDGLPDYYYLINNIVGTFDITESNVRQRNDFSSSGIVTVNPVPIPAALPLLAAGLGALGFTGWRRKWKLA